MKKFKFKAAEPWLEMKEYNKLIYCCSNKNCGWFGLESNELQCPLCGSTVDDHAMIKPWGFAAREGKNIPETRDSQEYSAVSIPSYSSMPQDLSKMKPISQTGLMRMENRENQQIIMINKGPKEEGFDLCNICGAIDPSECLEEEKEIEKGLIKFRLPKMTTKHVLIIEKMFFLDMILTLICWLQN